MDLKQESIFLSRTAPRHMTFKALLFIDSVDLHQDQHFTTDAWIPSETTVDLCN